jgi:DNA-binding Lrp family transcriptional regulator
MNPAPADAPLPAGARELGDGELIERLQGGFPLVDRPFAAVAPALGLREDVLIERLRVLLATGLLSHFGPQFRIERAGGRFALAAVAVPKPRFDAVAERVSAHREVAYNYRRDHALNMWFIVAVEHAAEVAAVIRRIESEIDLPVLELPDEREYLPGEAPSSGAGPVALDAFDRALVVATQGGLPLVARPYEAVAAVLGAGGAQVRERLGRMIEQGLVRRIRIVVNHYRMGLMANGMTVWDVDDTQVDALGDRIAGLPGVTHCYWRARRPSWRYNLYAMVHARGREDVAERAGDIEALLGPACRAHETLYASAILKKTGLRIRDE